MLKKGGKVLKSGSNQAAPFCAMTFSACARDWLEMQSSQLKESSIVKYRNTINKHLIPQFGDLSPTDIRQDDLFAFSRSLLDSGLSGRSAVTILSLMRSILRYARQCGVPTEDPGPITLKQASKPPRVFSRGEQERFTAYLFRQDDMGSRGILLSLYTGLRIGELCALKWGDIQFEDRCIQIRRTVQRLQTLEGGPKTAIHFASPKSISSVREIPLTDEMIEALQKIRKPDDCFFLSGSADRPVEPRTMEYRFKVAIRACGISDASFHTCRHSFATRCVELGFDVKTLSEILGHASVNITMNRYVHPSMEFKRENMKRLSALYPKQL